jgi:hypothetical protein
MSMFKLCARPSTLAPALVLYCLTTAACTRVATTAIRHPMQVGQVDENHVAVPQPVTESTYALPAGTLNNQAQLTRVDAEALCAQVWLKEPHDGQGPAPDPWDHWYYELETGDGQRLRDGRARLSQPTAQQYPGRVPQEVVVAVRDECVEESEDGRCRAWEQRPITETQWVPGIVTVVAGGAQICFPNDGRVSPATTSLKLKLSRPAVGVHFEWLFASAVNNQ